MTASISAIALCISSGYGLGQRTDDVFAYDKIMFFKVFDWNPLHSARPMPTILKADRQYCALQLFWVANASFTMSNALVKLSLLAQYLRVFELPAMRMSCKALIVLISVWGSIYSFIAWFPCFPPSGFWEFESTALCYGYASPDPFHTYRTVVSATASNMAFDILTWALPIHLLADKHLERKTKRALLSLLLLGTM